MEGLVNHDGRFEPRTECTLQPAAPSDCATFALCDTISYENVYLFMVGNMYVLKNAEKLSALFLCSIQIDKYSGKFLKVLHSAKVPS